MLRQSTTLNVQSIEKVHCLIFVDHIFKTIPSISNALKSVKILLTFFNPIKIVVIVCYKRKRAKKAARKLTNYVSIYDRLGALRAGNYLDPL